MSVSAEHRERLTANVVRAIARDAGWAFDADFVLRRDACAASLARANAPQENHRTPPNGESVVEFARYAFCEQFAKRVRA